MSGPVFITGHRGLLGSALLRASEGRKVITATRAELDLCDGDAVAEFIHDQKPAAIIHAAARNGGVALHEAEPAMMLADNLAIALNVIRAAADARVPRLLYVSSATVYAGEGSEPLAESRAGAVMPTGPTAGYALAKLAGMALCDAVRRQHGLTFHSIIPCNLYGPGDNYHPQHSTVAPALLRRMHDAIATNATAFPLWGSGRQRREFLHAEDVAAACLHLLALSEPPARANCGPGGSTSIMELAREIQAVTQFSGTIVPDLTKPDGPPRPALDCTLLHHLGWSPRISLASGLRSTYEAFLKDSREGILRG